MISAVYLVLAFQTLPATPPRPAGELRFYYDCAASNLSDEQKNVLDAAARRYRASSTRHVDLVGHADCEGPPEQDLRISLQRAKAVRQALAIRGVPAGAISINAVGDQRPPAGAKDDVSERRNRFVSITVR